LRAAPTYHDEEVHEEEEEEEEEDARSYAGDDMADMPLHDDDYFLSRRVVLQEEQHNEVISLSLSSLPMCSCYASKLNQAILHWY
jgi:hypothetical protein